MLLFLNTTQAVKAEIALLSEKFSQRKVFPVNRDLSEKLVLEIKKFLQKNRTSLRAIKKIVVVAGPGAYSATRTGVAYGNALAYALDVPIRGVNAAHLPKNLLNLFKIATKSNKIRPVYAFPPKITRSKFKPRQKIKK